MRHPTACDIAFAVLWPLVIWAFYVTAAPEHAALEAGRVALVTLGAYGLGTNGRHGAAT